jgi:hypothetical protein
MAARGHLSPRSMMHSGRCTHHHRGVLSIMAATTSGCSCAVSAWSTRTGESWMVMKMSARMRVYPPMMMSPPRAPLIHQR